MGKKNKFYDPGLILDGHTQLLPDEGEADLDAIFAPMPTQQGDAPTEQIAENTNMDGKDERASRDMFGNTDTTTFPPEEAARLVAAIEADKGERLKEYDAAKIVMKHKRFLMVGSTMYFCDQGIYRRVSENEALAIIKECFSEEMLQAQNTAFWSGVLRQIKSTKAIFFKRDAMSRLKRSEFAFANGIYNVKKDQWRDIMPEDFLFAANAVKFKPDVDCQGKRTEKFFNDFSDGDPQIQALAWTMVGCVLSSGNAFKKFFLLYGPPSTGKSVLGHIMERLVGGANCSYLDLSQIAQRGGGGQLENKLLNINLDISTAELKDLGLFKRATSGGTDMIECETTGQRFVAFRPDQIKFVFACNTFPEISGKEDPKPFFDRMILVPFLDTVPEHKRDYDLKDALWKERQYIIQKALQHYKMLVENNFHFPECQLSEELKGEFIESYDTVGGFVRRCCMLDEEVQEENETLYDAYKSFCQQRKQRALSRRSFITRLRSHYRLSDFRPPAPEGEARTHWTKGITLRAGVMPDAIF